MKHHVFHVRRHIFVKIGLFTTVLLLTLLTMSKPVQAVPKLYWVDSVSGAMRVNPDGSHLEFLDLWGGSDIALDPGAGKTYIADANVGGLIYRMNTDASEFETLINLERFHSHIDDIALDLSAGKIYWVFGRQFIERANLDGSEIESLVSLPEGSQIYGLALDTEAGKMYWTDQRTDAIQRANLDGTNREDVFVFAYAKDPCDIALDINAGKMYWTARNSQGRGYIYRANLNGSDHEALVDEFGPEPGEIALDLANGKMIWVDEKYELDSDGHVVHGGKIYQSDLDGGNREIFVDQFIGNDFVGGIPTGLAVADMPTQAAEQLYWVDREFHRQGFIPPGEEILLWRGNLQNDRNREILMKTQYSPIPTGAIAVDVVAGKMYYGCKDGIWWSNLDGSDAEDLISTTDPPETIALDIAAGKIYWTQTDRIQRANLDGTEIEDVLTDPNHPCDLALDLLAGKIYWVNAGGAIWRANLDGTDEFFVPIFGWLAKRIALDAQAGNMYVIAEPAGEGPPDGHWSVYKMLRVHGYSGFDFATAELFDLDVHYGDIENADVALDLTNSKIYWTEPSKDEIWRANLDGTDRETFRNVRYPMGIALGANVPVQAFPKIYWTDYGTGTIKRANPDGTDVEFLVNTGLTKPIGIALDHHASKMYWIDTQRPLFETKIQRADLNGLNVEDLVYNIVGWPGGLALDLDAGKMYWTEYITNLIQRANLDGSDQEPLVNGLSAPLGIALDLGAGKMYWTSVDAGKIQRADLEGTNVEDLVTDLSTPRGIALDLDAGKMYWTDNGSGKIQRANLDGSGVEDLLTGLGEDLAFIALDLGDGKMYWATYHSERIERANLDGSDRETVASSGERTYGIALDVPRPAIPWMQTLPASDVRNAVDRLGGTALIDVNPGDVFSYLITATNFFDHAMFLTIYDALDEYLDYVAGTFTVNGITSSDEFFAGGILDYRHPDPLNTGETLELEFDVIVQDLAPHDWVIGNTALITFSLDPQDLSRYTATLETNRAEVRVENPIPEPSTFFFLATGLLVFLTLGRRRQNTRK